MSDRRPVLIGGLCASATVCVFISEGGRCEKALAPHYSEIIKPYRSQACSAFNEWRREHAQPTVNRR